MLHGVRDTLPSLHDGRVFLAAHRPTVITVNAEDVSLIWVLHYFAAAIGATKIEHWIDKGRKCALMSRA
jgi:hypothetical protein